MSRLDVVLAAISDHFGDRKPTHYQVDILSHLIDGSGHGIVKACPGSGKTTTLKMGVVAINAVADGNPPAILATSFSKKIVEAIGEALDGFPNANCRGMNSIGYGVLRKDRRFYNCRLDDNKTDLMIEKASGYAGLNDDEKVKVNVIRPAVRTVIGLYKNFGFGAVRPFASVDELVDIVDKHGIELPEDVNPEAFHAFCDQVIKCSNKEFSIIDFNDQLYLPVLLNMDFPGYYKYILIDESQDLNTIQVEMVKRMSRTRGEYGRPVRTLWVGDTWQSIYGFRGADPEAMENVENDFTAKSLPLSICWRCSKAVVREAQKINPDIEFSPNAPEGSVNTIKSDEMIDKLRDGDMVLCRTSAPLVAACLEAIRAKKKAYVLGTDMATRLNATIQKVVKRKYDGSIYHQIIEYRNTDLMKIKNEKQRDAMMDRMDTLAVLAEDCETVAELKDKIRSIFSEEKAGIMFSTIHKAKGLESENVYIIKPELLPHPMARQPWERVQERNLKFVAVTRAQMNLYYVSSKRTAVAAPETPVAAPEPPAAETPKKAPRKRTAAPRKRTTKAK